MFIPETEIIVSRNGEVLFRQIVTPGDYVIGREDGTDVKIDVPLVSRKHAQLTVNYSEMFIQDLGSSNGTLLNGEPVNEITRIWPSQKIQIGEATIEARRIKTQSEGDASLPPEMTAVRRLLPEEVTGDRRYEIGKVVAQGGMGAILNARDAAISRSVAMKVMLQNGSGEDAVRFVEEAKITGQLEHPNIVPVHELSVDEHGHPYYTMKFVRGITLKKVLDLLKEGVAETVAKYPLASLLTVFQKVCDAVAFAHSKRVIHRDLKPENIMIGDYGEVLVMDWGLAKVLGIDDLKSESRGESQIRSVRNADADSVTMAGTIMGTPRYMAPEQARGEIDSLDARSDVYSLGAILFEMLYQHPPVTGRSVGEIVDRVGRGELDWTPAKSPAPESLLAVCRKALSLVPVDRYAKVEDLQQDITAFQNGFATTAEGAGLAKQLSLLVKRNKAASLGIAAVLIVGVTLGTKAIVEGRRAEREATHARAEAKRAERGEASANAALMTLKQSAPSLFALGESEAGLQRFDSALNKINAAIALDPDLNPPYWRRAWVLLAQERFAESVQAVRAAQLHDPANADRLGAILPLLIALSSASPEERWIPARSSAVLTHLNAVGASGEAIALSGRFQLSSADKLLLVKQRVEAWLGKPLGRVATDGSVLLDGFPKTIDTLEPLRGLPIDFLGLGSTAVKSLEPLRGMRLSRLQIPDTRISDLSPLVRMPLTSLEAGHTTVADLTPLHGMPLIELGLSNTNVRDLTPLSGMPLKKLNISATSVSDLTPLRGMALEELYAADMKGPGLTVADVAALSGMPLKILTVRAADYSPLAGMEFDRLDVLDGGLALTSLKGVRAQSLRIAIPATRSVEPLKDIQFKILDLTTPQSLRDLTPLRDCLEMEEFTANGCPAPIEPLRGHPTLKRLSYNLPGEPRCPMMPVEKFWEEYDSKHKAEKPK